MSFSGRMGQATFWILACVLFTLDASAQSSPVGQVIDVSVWNAGGAGGSLDASGFPTTPPGAQDSFVFGGAWHPVFGTSLEVKAVSFGEVIPAGSAACNPTNSPDVVGDCEYVEFTVREVGSGGGLGSAVPAPAEQSAVRFSGIGSPGSIRNADVGAGLSNFYSYFSDDDIPVSGAALAALEIPDLLGRPAVPAVVLTTDVSEIAPLTVGLSTADLGGVPLAEYTTVFGLPLGWDGVTVGIVLEERLAPSVPAFAPLGQGLLLVMSIVVGAVASRGPLRMKGEAS